MYVDYATYSKSPFGGKVAEDDYASYSALADSVIDSWTFGRVGEEVAGGGELPQQVTSLYSAIVSGIPALVDESAGVGGSALTSFSNGVDSYGFDVTIQVADRLWSSLRWLYDALPLRYVSSAANQPTGRCWHD